MAVMFSERKAQALMTIENAVLAFINRINDAYVLGHTVHDLINDYEYQKLQIKHGPASGMRLGNQHILPGYWFTVFVAPYESLENLLSIVLTEKQAMEEERANIEASEENRSIMTAVERFKNSYHESLIKSVEKFKTDLDVLMVSIDPLVRSSMDSFPNKRPLKRFKTAVATGSYNLSEDIDGDVVCTFYENDVLCGYRFEVTTKVATFNQFCMDFIKQMAEMLWPLVEGHKKIGEQVSNMIIGEVFWKHVD